MLFISIGGGGYKIVTSSNKKCLHLNQKGTKSTLHWLTVLL